MSRLGLLLVLVTLWIAGCGGSGGDGEIVATIGDRQLTRTDIDRRFAEMPPQVQPQFEGEEGLQRLLDGMLDEEAFLLAALDMKLEENLDVKRQIESAKRRVLIQSYYQREVAPYTQMTEEDMIAVYEENLEEFTKPEESEVRQVVLATDSEAKRVRRMLLNGAKWERVVQDYCIDEPTKKREGRIGPVQKQASLIPLVGASFELMWMIDTLTVGTISPVVRTGKGYHVITVERRNPETEVAFEKVRDTIRRNYSQQFAERVRKEKVALLREKFGVDIRMTPAELAAVGRTVEEESEEDRPAAKLFKLAQATTDPLQRIKYYKEIVQNHAEDDYACEAQFMIGFVYSEELHDFDLARDAFQKVVDEPEGCSEDILENSRWMLDNMGGEPPAFED